MTASTARPTAPPAPRRSIAVAIARRPRPTDGAPTGADVVDRERRHRVDRWLGPADQLGPRLPFVARLLQRRPGARSGRCPLTRRSSSATARSTTLLVIAVAAVFVAVWRSAPRRRRARSVGLGHPAGRARPDPRRRGVDLHPPEPAGRGRALHAVHGAHRGRDRALVARPRGCRLGASRRCRHRSPFRRL